MDGQLGVEPDDVVRQDNDWLFLRQTAAVCAAFDKLNVFLAHATEHAQPNPSRILQIPKKIRFEEYTSFLGERLHESGAFSYCETPSADLCVGRYCSIAGQLLVFGERHPVEWVTTSSITYCFYPHWNKPQFLRAHRDMLQARYKPEPNPQLSAPTLQHDVWIGQRVQLARGITIGTGAVVAAGSVVTKDVAPYTIVAGVPARQVRLRFSQRTVSRLLETHWWDYGPEVLWRFGFKDPERFCTGIEQALRRGEIERHTHRRWSWHDVLTALGT